MKILLGILFVLSSISIALADIPPLNPKENNPNQNPQNESTCLGFVLIFLAVTFFIAWFLKKRSFNRNA